MTNAQFSRPGAVDLSALARQASQPAQAAGGSYVTEVTEATFESMAQASMGYPVILELWSPRAQGADQLAADLADLANASGGRWVLGRVNVDEQVRIAQALQVQAVPTVIALIGGQAAPLFQGTRSREEIAAVLDQVLELAAASGMVQRAQPVASAAHDASSPAQPAANPRFEKADAALEQGDYAAAVKEFDALLAATPNDAEAIAGRAQAALLQRTSEPAADDATEVDAALAAADREILRAEPQAAFDRLLAALPGANPADRERVRVRMLELFEVVGKADPVVMKARRALSTALF